MIQRIVCLSIAGFMFNVFADGTPTVSAMAVLKDGSAVKGKFLTDKVEGTTLFAKNLSLDVALVRTLNFTNTNGEAKVELSNGDRFGMTIVNPSFVVKSLLGELNIQRRNFRSISFSNTIEGDAAGGLIFHCTFDNGAAITSPAVGPAGRFITGDFVEGKYGQALMTMPYTKHAAFDFPAGFIKDSGCIEFWVKILKPNPVVGTGGDPRFFIITYADTHETVCKIDLVSNDGDGNSGFALQTWFGGKSSIRGMRHLRYADLFNSGDWRDWHHYAVVWDKDGIAAFPHAPKAALLVDGKLVSTTGFEPLTHMIRMPSETPFVLGFTNDPVIEVEHTTKSSFLIDEFKIWNFAKKDFLFN